MVIKLASVIVIGRGRSVIVTGRGRSVIEPPTVIDGSAPSVGDSGAKGSAVEEGEESPSASPAVSLGGDLTGGGFGGEASGRHASSKRSR